VDRLDDAAAGEGVVAAAVAVETSAIA